MAKEFKLVSLIQIAMYILSKRLGMLGPLGGVFVHLNIIVKQDVILSTTFSHARLVMDFLIDGQISSFCPDQSEAEG